MKTPPLLNIFDQKKQVLLDELLDQNRNGTISAEDCIILKALVNEAENLMVRNAKLLSEFVEDDVPVNSAGAIPVTIWIKPSTPTK